MARKPLANSARYRFAKLLADHLANGTRPATAAGEPWTFAEFAGEIPGTRDNQYASERTVSNWCAGTSLPMEIEPILRALFGPRESNRHIEARSKLRAAFLAGRAERIEGESLSPAERDWDSSSTFATLPRPGSSSKEGGRLLTLTTQRANPQWADYRDYLVGAACPWVLRCQITTESPYFRFGLKLLSDRGRVFGDGLIQSYDPNMVIHIGRNDWDRPRMGITAQDIFLTTYMNGIAIEDDTFLFRAEQRLTLPIELLVDETYRASLGVNGQLVSQRIVPPAICGRVSVLAWGDREEFRVDVTDLTIEPVHK
jgi:hypothetical protein